MTQAKDEMSYEVVYLTTEHSLTDACVCMEDHRYRHLPILEGKKLVGILSDRDVYLRAQLRDGVVEVPNIPVTEAMSRDVITCKPEDRIGDIADLMLDKKVDALPVINAQDELIGMLTSSNLLSLLRRKEGVLDQDLVDFSFAVKGAQKQPPSEEGL